MNIGGKAALSSFTLETKGTSLGFATTLLVQADQLLVLVFQRVNIRVLCGTSHLSLKPCWFSLNIATMVTACPLVTKVLQYEITFVYM